MLQLTDTIYAAKYCMPLRFVRMPDFGTKLNAKLTVNSNHLNIISLGIS